MYKRQTYARRIAIPLQGDCFDKLRTEYTGMLQSQLARGNNGLIKTKYLTFGVEADSLKAAKPRLERIETDIPVSYTHLDVYKRQDKCRPTYGPASPLCPRCPIE